MLCHFVFHNYLSVCCFSHKKKRRRLTELTQVASGHLVWPYALWEMYFPLPNGAFLPLFLRRLPDRAVFHASQQPDVSGAAQWDHLHQNALLRHHRPGLGTPLRAVPRPAAPLQAGVHPQHSHRSLSRSENVMIKRSLRAG